MFAIVDDNTLFFRVDDGSRPAFERAGMARLTYESRRPSAASPTRLSPLPPRARAQAQARPQGAEVGVHHEGRRGAVEARPP